MFEGKILDGRNRAIACQRAGEKLKTKQFKGTRQQALEHVWSTNFARRHMTSSQRAMVTAERKKTDPAFAEQCELMDQEAAQRKAQAKGKPRGEKASEGESIPTETKDDRRTATVLAKASGTNRKYLELAEKVYDDHPEYVEPIKRGTRPPGNEGHRLGAALARSRQAALIEMQRAAAQRVMLSTIVVVHFQP